MKLMTALKEKNRLAGEVSRLLVILHRENSRRDNSTSKVDVQKIYEEWIVKKQQLATLKGTISLTNIGIYPKIALMGELKDQLSSLETLPTKDGEFDESVGGYGTNPVKAVYKAFLTAEKVDDLNKTELQQEVNKLQDSIDEYNSITEIVTV